MNLKIASLAGLGIALIGIFYLFDKNLIFSRNIVTISIQILAAGLMIWARLTFGIRSFHATANTTKGGLVTNGPYHWFRHPIYAALIYFFWSCVIAFPFKETIFGVILITVGLLIRIFLEEKFLIDNYKEQYLDYSKHTKRIIPYIF
ncbi:MAG: isoprenylcysteine carboxylmethyltransferase family protein [Chitinophagaceae bacterium]